MMKKVVFALLLVLTIFSSRGAFADTDDPKFRKEQQQKLKSHLDMQKFENDEFRSSLKSMTPDERKKAIVRHRDKQMADNKAFREKMHAENMAYLKEKLSADKTLDEKKKNEFISFWEGEYKKEIAFQDKQQAESIAYFDKITDDPLLNTEQKRSSIRRFIEEQKARHKAFRDQLQADRKAFQSQAKAKAKS